MMPWSRALWAVQSSSVPDIIDKCFFVKASLIHWNTHKNLIFNRYILTSHMCSILQAQHSQRRLTCYDQTLSDLSVGLCALGQTAVSIETLNCFANIQLQLFRANTLKLVWFGMTCTLMSVIESFHLCSFFKIQWKRLSFHFFQYGSVILFCPFPSMHTLHWLDFVP